jgi:divinyl chlorophyllide a 8-vinyl-reductase
MMKVFVLVWLTLATKTRAFVAQSKQQWHSSSSALQAQKTAVVAGATGYIGKSVVREAVRQGYQTIALVRDASKVSSKQGKASYDGFLDGAQVVECDVTNAEDVTRVMNDITANTGKKIDAIVSCLASRSGIKKDAYLIDYQATLNCLEAGRAAKAGHFVLLSAFCVKNPWLQFQQAKLKFEAALQAQQDMSWSIVRPTAFFKSVSGQLEVCQSGAPYVMFGNGEVTRCNPIAESDLATYLMDCVTDKSRHQKIINLGGPDEPLTMKMQGEMLFRALNMQPKYFNAPLWLFDVIINTIQFFADITGSEQLEDAAETGRIGKYYAVEDMLTTKPEEKYGTITLQDHYNRIAVEGQEYDPYTTMFARARMGEFGEKSVLLEEEPVPVK